MKNLFIDFAFIVAVAFFCSPVFATDAPALEPNAWRLTVPALTATATPTPAITTTKPKPKFDWQLFGSATALQLATVADLRSTFNVFKRCATCYEANPLLRPIINKPAAAYAVTAAINGYTIYSMKKLKDKGKWYWWTLAIPGTAAHLLAARHNNSIK